MASSKLLTLGDLPAVGDLEFVKHLTRTWNLVHRLLLDAMYTMD
jgi:hypothetical protein